MITHLLFDIGKVCFHVDWQAINDEMLRRFGITTLVHTAGNETARRYHHDALEGKRHPRECFSVFNTGGHDLEDVSVAYKQAFMDSKVHDERMYALIRKLKEHYTVVCHTDANELHLEAHQEQGTIDDFHQVFSSVELGVTKRDPASFQKVLAALGAAPHEVLFIDDHQENIDAAVSLGIKSIPFTGYDDLLVALQDAGILLPTEQDPVPVSPHDAFL